MDGPISAGWYDHPRLGLIKISTKNGQWVYVCYTSNGAKPISLAKPIDEWTWALCQATESMDEEED